ncbi:hypothetical protein DFH09DRAFT_1099544 [Mycena vulgaris]|nr:hypothetical protein DFH09DRAFT_1099544 [Mycena vulgaris]
MNWRHFTIHPFRRTLNYEMSSIIEHYGRPSHFREVRREPTEDFIEISDDEHTPASRISVPGIIDMKPVLRDIINLCDSKSETEAHHLHIKPEAKPELAAASHHKPERFRNVNGLELIKISLSEKVHHVVQAKVLVPVMLGGRPEEGGPRGLTPFRRLKYAILACAIIVVAATKCQYFDDEILAGDERTDGPQLPKLLLGFSVQRKNNLLIPLVEFFFNASKPAGPRPAAMESRFSSSAEMYSRNDGKMTFLGCSKWVQEKKWIDTCLSIPADVDEPILASYLDGSVTRPPDPETRSNPKASVRGLHPWHGKHTECPRDGKALRVEMVKHACTATKIVYILQVDVRKRVIILNRHPAKQDVKKCLPIWRTLGETGGHLNTSTTTRALLRSSIDVKHSALRDTRRLRNEVSRLKGDATRAGRLWANRGDYASNLALYKPGPNGRNGRYLGLATLLRGDDVSYMECDIPLKRTKEEMNEWEALIWYTPTFEHKWAKVLSRIIEDKSKRGNTRNNSGTPRKYL